MGAFRSGDGGEGTLEQGGEHALGGGSIGEHGDVSLHVMMPGSKGQSLLRACTRAMIDLIDPPNMSKEQFTQ